MGGNQKNRQKNKSKIFLIGSQVKIYLKNVNLKKKLLKDGKNSIKNKFSNIGRTNKKRKLKKKNGPRKEMMHHRKLLGWQNLKIFGTDNHKNKNT